jgi:hypothetical protein
LFHCVDLFKFCFGLLQLPPLSGYSFINRNLIFSYKPSHSIADKFLDAVDCDIRRTLDQFRAPGIVPDFRKQVPHCFHPYLGPVIPLGEGALTVRTRDNANTSDPAFQGVEDILGINLTAARDLFYPDV